MGVEASNEAGKVQDYAHNGDATGFPATDASRASSTTYLSAFPTASPSPSASAPSAAAASPLLSPTTLQVQAQHAASAPSSSSAPSAAAASPLLSPTTLQVQAQYAASAPSSPYAAAASPLLSPTTLQVQAQYAASAPSSPYAAAASPLLSPTTLQVQAQYAASAPSASAPFAAAASPLLSPTTLQVQAQYAAFRAAKEAQQQDQRRRRAERRPSTRHLLSNTVSLSQPHSPSTPTPSGAGSPATAVFIPSLQEHDQEQQQQKQAVLSPALTIQTGITSSDFSSVSKSPFQGSSLTPFPSSSSFTASGHGARVGGNRAVAHAPNDLLLQPSQDPHQPREVQYDHKLSSKALPVVSTNPRFVRSGHLMTDGLSAADPIADPTADRTVDLNAGRTPLEGAKETLVSTSRNILRPNKAIPVSARSEQQQTQQTQEGDKRLEMQRTDSVRDGTARAVTETFSYPPSPCASAPLPAPAPSAPASAPVPAPSSSAAAVSLLLSPTTLQVQAQYAASAPSAAAASPLLSPTTLQVQAQYAASAPSSSSAPSAAAASPLLSPTTLQVQAQYAASAPSSSSAPSAAAASPLLSPTTLQVQAQYAAFRAVKEAQQQDQRRRRAERRPSMRHLVKSVGTYYPGSSTSELLASAAASTSTSMEADKMAQAATVAVAGNGNEASSQQQQQQKRTTEASKPLQPWQRRPISPTSASIRGNVHHRNDVMTTTSRLSTQPALGATTAEKFIASGVLPSAPNESAGERIESVIEHHNDIQPPLQNIDIETSHLSTGSALHWAQPPRSQRHQEQQQINDLLDHVQVMSPKMARKAEDESNSKVGGSGSSLGKVFSPTFDSTLLLPVQSLSLSAATGAGVKSSSYPRAFTPAVPPVGPVASETAGNTLATRSSHDNSIWSPQQKPFTDPFLLASEPPTGRKLSSSGEAHSVSDNSSISTSTALLHGSRDVHYTQRRRGSEQYGMSARRRLTPASPPLTYQFDGSLPLDPYKLPMRMLTPTTATAAALLTVPVPVPAPMLGQGHVSTQAPNHPAARAFQSSPRPAVSHVVTRPNRQQESQEQQEQQEKSLPPWDTLTPCAAEVHLTQHQATPLLTPEAADRKPQQELQQKQQQEQQWEQNLTQYPPMHSTSAAASTSTSLQTHVTQLDTAALHSPPPPPPPPQSPSHTKTPSIHSRPSNPNSPSKVYSGKLRQLVTEHQKNTPISEQQRSFSGDEIG